MTKSIRKYLLAAVAIGALSVGTTQGAKAAELVTSAFLNITNITYYWDFDNDGVGDQIVDINDFSVVDGANNADASGDLDSIGGTTSDSGSTAIIAGGEVDIAQQCEGGCGDAPAENSTTINNTMGGHYASGDSDLSGIPVTGTPVPVGSDSLTRTDIELNKGDVGSSTANTGTTTSLVFVLGDPFNGASIVIEFDWEVAVYAEMVDAYIGSSMLSSVGWDADLFSSTAGVALNVDLGDLTNCSITGGTAIEPGPNGCTDSGSASFQTAALISGVQYTLVVRQTAESDATLVPIPEPGTVGAIGLGLLSIAGIGWRNRRRKDA